MSDPVTEAATEQSASEFLDRYILTALRYGRWWLLIGIAVGGLYVAWQVRAERACKTSWIIRSPEAALAIQTVLSISTKQGVAVTQRGNGLLQVVFWTAPQLCGSGIVTIATAKLKEFWPAWKEEKIEELDKQIAKEKSWLQQVPNARIDLIVEIEQRISEFERQKKELTRPGYNLDPMVPAETSRESVSIGRVVIRAILAATFVVVLLIFAFDFAVSLWLRIQQLKSHL